MDYWEATVSICETSAGWCFQFDFDDGRQVWTEQTFETKQEALTALKAWEEQNCVRSITAQ